jgi:hypothetical protein
MGYSIKPSEDRDYIVLTVLGEIKGQSMMKYIIEAHALGKEMGINRYLVDVTKDRNIDSILGNYGFAYSDMKKTEGVDTMAKVAALVSPEDHSHDFIETVLSNAGLFLKIFTDLDIAREYLIKN